MVVSDSGMANGSELPTPPEALEAAVTALLSATTAITLPLDLPTAAAAQQARAEIEHILTTAVLPRLQAPEAPLLVALAGPTGVGKSTLFNALVGAPLSATGPLRPTTRTPVLACHPEDMAGGVVGDGAVNAGSGAGVGAGEPVSGYGEQPAVLVSRTVEPVSSAFAPITPTAGHIGGRPSGREADQSAVLTVPTKSAASAGTTTTAAEAGVPTAPDTAGAPKISAAPTELPTSAGPGTPIAAADVPTAPHTSGTPDTSTEPNTSAAPAESEASAGPTPAAATVVLTAPDTSAEPEISAAPTESPASAEPSAPAAAADVPTALDTAGAPDTSAEPNNSAAPTESAGPSTPAAATDVLT
ncbi:MAG: GTPase, partial [Catenulispora sp.]